MTRLAGSVLRLGAVVGAAVASLVRHPLRAGLTGVGISVGVLSVTTVISLGEGAEARVQTNVERLGETLMTIRPEARETSGARESERPSLIERDAEALSREVSGATFVAPVLDGLSRVASQGRNATAQIVGTTRSYFGARNYRLSAGSVWSPADEAASRRVVLLGPTVVDELFGGEQALGESLRLGRHLFLVVGILESKGQTPFGMDQDNVVVMPIGAMRSKVAKAAPGEVRQILVRAADPDDVAGVMKKSTALLRQRHKIAEGEEDDFSVRDQSRVADAQRGVVGVMRALLLSIAAVSLFIGGVGVMNIMLVSVAERNREIGTRMAVGARAFDVLLQFLVESVILSLLGGSIGAALSFALVIPLEGYFGFPIEVSLRALLVALSVSLLVGVGFGFLPARRAAHLDPSEALRR